MTGWDDITSLLEQRQRLNERLMACLKHLPIEQQFHIITSWFSIEELTKLVEFQER